MFPRTKSTYWKPQCHGCVSHAYYPPGVKIELMLTELNLKPQRATEQDIPFSFRHFSGQIRL